MRAIRLRPPSSSGKGGERRSALGEHGTEGTPSQCPRCGERLEHIRIRKLWADQCPLCEGVWLDRPAFCELTQGRAQPLAAMFRWMLVDQCMGDIPSEHLGR